LVAGQNVDVLAQQIVEFRPSVASVATSAARDRLIERLREIGMPSLSGPICSMARNPASIPR
jgi:1-deoxy-D-xylulose 5-phosphate reductoisomerase